MPRKNVKVCVSPLDGRACSSEQKRAVIERLFDVWSGASSLRLGQLISTSLDTRRLFYIEDMDLIGMVERSFGARPTPPPERESSKIDTSV